MYIKVKENTVLLLKNVKLLPDLIKDNMQGILKVFQLTMWINAWMW